MEHIDYDDVLGVEESDLDCLSLEALFAELLLEETGMVSFPDASEE